MHSFVSEMAILTTGGVFLRTCGTPGSSLPGRTCQEVANSRAAVQSGGPTSQDAKPRMRRVNHYDYSSRESWRHESFVPLQIRDPECD